VIPNSPTQYRGTHTPTHTSSRVRVSFSLHRSSKIDSRPRFGRFPRTDFTRAYPVAPSPHAITASLPPPLLPSHQPNQDHSIRGGCVSLRSAPTTHNHFFPRASSFLHGCPIGTIRSDSIPPKQLYHVGGFILRDTLACSTRKGLQLGRIRLVWIKKPHSHRRRATRPT